MKQKMMAFQIDKDLGDKFRKICRIEDRNMSQLIRDYIREYVKDYEQKNQK